MSFTKLLKCEINTASSKFGNSNGPRGRPDSIFFLPHLFDSEDYKTPVVSDEIDEFLNKSTMCAEDFSKEFEEFSLTAMNS